MAQPDMRNIQGFITHAARDELLRRVNQLIDHDLRDLPYPYYPNWRDALTGIREVLLKLIQIAELDDQIVKFKEV